MNSTFLSSLQLYNLISPALPIGSFAYSQGIEFAIEDGWLKTQEDIYNWISSVLLHSVAYWDLASLHLMQQALTEHKTEQLLSINAQLLASRESKELLLEDQQVGKALLKLLQQQDIDINAELMQQPSVCLGYAIAAHHYSIDKQSVLMGFCWTWCENQVAAAGKTLPLGQKMMQSILQKLMPDIQTAVQTALPLTIENMGNSLPMLALASSLHQHQYSRLFRS